MLRFGEHVLAAKVAKATTLDRIAKACGTHKGYVSGIIKGKVAPPSPKVVARLCKRLDLPAEDMQALAFLEKRPKEVTLNALRDLVLAAIEERDKALLQPAVSA